jgi:DtxR family Mn-dependent transcriptional regulator
MYDTKPRSQKLSIAQERYVECIQHAQKLHGHAHISFLAETLRIKKPSVIQMVRRLEDEGIIERQPRGVRLTQTGQHIAHDLLSRHALLQQFMETKLGMTPSEANLEACRLEHLVSPTFVSGLRSFLSQ